MLTIFMVCITLGCGEFINLHCKQSLLVIVLIAALAASISDSNSEGSVPCRGSTIYCFNFGFTSV